MDCLQIKKKKYLACLYQVLVSLNVPLLDLTQWHPIFRVVQKPKQSKNRCTRRKTFTHMQGTNSLTCKAHTVHWRQRNVRLTGELHTVHELSR